MTTIFGHIPPEIQTKIFGYISRKSDFLECQLTCKYLNEYSSQPLYKSITFDSKNIEKAGGFMEALNRREYLKGLIKHIELQYPYQYEGQYQTLLKFFADECPNIQTAALCGKAEDEFYLKELCHKNWKYLEKVRIRNNSRSESAIEIANQHQETIKELELHESDEFMLCDEKGDEQEVKEKLAKFKSLEAVSIIIQNPRHLSSLDSWIPENVKLLKLELEIPSIKQDIIDPEYIDWKKIIPCPNIKELTLDIYLSGDSSIEYLMHKFPNLEKLYHRGNKIISVSQDTRNAFCDYLLNIKHFRFIYTLVCNSDDPMDHFFIKRLIENSKAKNSKNQRDLTVRFNTKDNFSNKVLVCKKTNNSVESCRISVGLKESQKLNFLENFGADLTGLTITKSNYDELNLNLIFKHCSNLKSLDIREFDTALGEELKENPMNLETLEYSGSMRFTPQVLSGWSKHFPNLTTLAFSGSKDTTIDFSNIITNFSNLKCLKITNVELSLSNPDKKSSTIKKLNLNACKFSSNKFFSDLSHSLSNIDNLELCINGDDLESDEFILNIPETSLKELSVYVDYNGSKQPTSLLKVSLPIDGKKTDNNKRYYFSTVHYTCTMKEHTEAEYESVISESTKGSPVFQLIVNCKEFPMIMKPCISLSGIAFKAGTFVC